MESRALKEGRERVRDGRVVVGEEDEGAVVFRHGAKRRDVATQRLYGIKSLRKKVSYGIHAKVDMMTAKTADSAARSKAGGGVE